MLFPLTMGLSMMAAAPIGFLGQALSLEFVVLAMGWITLVLAALIILRTPQLRKANPEPLGAPVAAPAGTSGGS